MIALLCSGQGHQHRGMFRLVAREPAAAPILAAAAAALGEEPVRFVAKASDAALHANRAAQILCVTQALALAAVLAPGLPARRLVAGYSVGALAAWSLSGRIAAPRAVQLAALRAEAMDDAGGADEGLAFVRGLPRPVVKVCAARFALDIAIENPGDLYVVGGGRGALVAFCEAAQAAGARRAGVLRVGVASHTGRLAGAVAPFAAALGKIAPGAAGVMLLAGSSGARIGDGDSAIQALAAQITAPLDWSACMDAAVERGTTTMLELGPGRALADMVQGRRDIRARSADEFETLRGLRDWLDCR